MRTEQDFRGGHKGKLTKFVRSEFYNTVDPPIPILYNQEKTYLGLKNQRPYWGEAVNGGAVLGRRTVP